MIVLCKVCIHVIYVNYYNIIMCNCESYRCLAPPGFLCKWCKSTVINDRQRELQLAVCASKLS